MTLLSSLFNQNVFTSDVAKKYLSAHIAAKLSPQHHFSEHPLTATEINAVANALKLWASEKGATHYTHWFQPLNGRSAVKHDAFLSRDNKGAYLETLEAGALLQQEPDASSFPNGGLRSTFEARGYSAWDPSSPPFIMEQQQNKTLYIPTIFISYTGASLDYKGPLLKSIRALKKEALHTAQIIDKSITDIMPTLGWEQEYFLIDLNVAKQRSDIRNTGRTLIGSFPAKGQQLEDHYFATIPARVHRFMCDLEQAAYKLGIPIKTRHNEVAPCQFECAPIFEEMNIAVDHNTLLMDLMCEIAHRHQLKVLLHEKPFQSINGSGKHCNWSLSANQGINLLSPGATPKSNLLFLTFFIAVIQAVYQHNALLRASVSSAGNDCRLGGFEAPPPVISVFIGQFLSEILRNLDTVILEKTPEQSVKKLKLDLKNHISDILLDNTDRNRTSPFAFTGNKFEFRAPGASANCAHTMIILNTIVAESLGIISKNIQKHLQSGKTKENAIIKTIQESYHYSKNILYNGDGYLMEWQKEAQKRGLCCASHTPEALKIWQDTAVQHLFSRQQIFTPSELQARYEVALEQYVKKSEIEWQTLTELIHNTVLPAALNYRILIQKNTSDAADTPSILNQQIQQINHHLHLLSDYLQTLQEKWAQLPQLQTSEQATLIAEDLLPLTQKLRAPIDQLEKIIPDDYWKIPKYHHLLYLD